MHRKLITASFVPADRAWRRLGLGISLLLAIAPLSKAQAADIDASRPKPPPAPTRWNGFYIGGHFGYGGGSLGKNVNAVPNQAVIGPPTVTGLVGGVQAGYNVQLPNNWVIGAEADLTFPSPADQTRVKPTSYHTTLDVMGTLRGRLGYAFGPFLPYVTGGLAYGRSKLDIVTVPDGNVISDNHLWHLGWTAGAGVEMALNGPWSARLEYSYTDLGNQTYRVGGVAFPTVRPQVHAVKFGLNYQFGDTSTPPVEASPDWNVHGQTTFIMQAYPRIRSAYAGQNSLPAVGLGRETWTASAFLGVRLWNGGEFYFNPELAQGFGLNSTLGIAGFPNGEAQKGGAVYAKIRPQRYYLRQTFGLGGEQEEVEDGPLQLPGKRDIDRITVIVGRFAVGDFFDGNSYAKDPRADFMNWSMWSSAAYDFPADLPGLTRGAVVELNRKDWAVRAGFFQVPQQPNSDDLVFKGGAGGAVEFEGRYTLFDRPGKLRLGAFLTRGRTADYNQVVGIAALNPAFDINDVTANTRRNRDKYGVYANLEQEVTDNIGFFARGSWNDGRSEILSFTDIDRSVSAGFSIKGTAWGRPDDRIGIGGAINGLSKAHQNFLAAGGYGLLIGDGRLNYGTEKILETFYSVKVNNWATVTFDYQFISNPAYNTARGPASVFSMRAHAEF
ncbi:carbohydrate porin [Methylocella sp. CPCC 101449]|uniref:carbohydrate porin n=1 Tax=Methylocella sp. CPCC 101449 TaxID=2987531 RepID=UPI00288DC1ED|nr:carbohydrate porin [Methylocella sp. CPCC 101449]MDT2020155.1 carbohydrate porin [Methylocella sp. CPCC 101449]